MTGTAITDQDINHLWWTAYQANDSRTAILATEALGHGPFGGADDIARARRKAEEIIRARRECGEWTEPPAPAADAGCPPWCAEHDDAGRHVGEWDDGLSSDGDTRHVLTRTVQDPDAGSEPQVELAVYDDDQGDIILTIAPDVADRIAASLGYTAGLARGHEG
jgi:hypothetical protein